METEIVKSKKMLSLIFAGIITIFLGAIGSGLWELFLSDFFYWLGSTFAKLFSSIFKNYLNVLHGRIGQGISDTFSLLPYVAVLVLIILSQWILYIFLLKSITKFENIDNGKRNSDDFENHKKDYRVIFNYFLIRKKFFKYFLVVIPLVITIFYSAFSYEDVYTRRAVIFIDRSIDILSPFLTGNELLKLKAEYRSIENADDFYLFYDKLISLSQNKNVKLPDFSPVR